MEPAAGPRGTRCHRQYSFRRQPEVAQRDKGVTTLTCFLPRGRRAQARSVGEGASPCQANLGVFHGRLLRRGVRAKGAGPSGRNKPAGFPLTFCLFVCLFCCLFVCLFVPNPNPNPIMIKCQCAVSKLNGYQFRHIYSSFSSQSSCFQIQHEDNCRTCQDQL